MTVNAGQARSMNRYATNRPDNRRDETKNGPAPEFRMNRHAEARNGPAPEFRTKARQEARAPKENTLPPWSSPCPKSGWEGEAYGGLVNNKRGSVPEGTGSPRALPCLAPPGLADQIIPRCESRHRISPAAPAAVLLVP